MAASSLDERYLELARSMEIASIPERIRCATCDKLAINAVKLPCCDSPVCGDCQRDKLPSNTECPICMHAPFAADMGVPAKSLQTTVKVFIKNEAKKRGIDLKTGKKIVSEVPASAEPPEVTTPALPSTLASNGAETPSMMTQGHTENTSATNDESGVAAEIDAAEVVTIKEESVQPNREMEENNGDQEHEDDDDEEDDVVITTERPELENQHQPEKDDQDRYEQQANNAGESSEQDIQASMNQQGFGFDAMTGFGAGNFGNMNMMNGFNPMMGMPGFGMGMPNMMNMPGMGMDPTMMFNGNFGGMGDMSMMGVGNMGGAMSGMGDFNGMGGPGFFPNQGNFMQSNYGNAQRQNFFNDRGYGRGYGRGFGRGARGNQYGRGRGGWGHQQQNQYSQNQQYMQQQQGVGPQQSAANDMEVANRRRASPTYEASQGRDGAAATPSEDKTLQSQADLEQGAQRDTNMTNEDTDQAVQSAEQMNENGHSAVPSFEGARNDLSNEYDGVVNANNISQMGDAYGPDLQTGISNDFDETTQYQQQVGNNEWGGRGGYRNGRGGHTFGRPQDSTELTPAPAPPINAPTGPKAMRQGLPNTGWAGRALTQPKPTPTPAPEVRAPSQSAELHHEAARQGDEDRGRSRSRSRSKHRSSRDKNRDDGYESDETYARRKDRERRKRKEREERHDEERISSKDDEKRSKKYRSRSESRTDEGSRRHHRDKDDDRRSSRSRRDRSKDKHRRRHRSRSPGKDDGQDEHSRRKSKSHAERDADHESGERHKDSKRSSRKHSTRDDDDYYKDDRKDRSHRSSRHDRSKDDARDRDSERPRPIIEPPSDELGFKIKGSKSAKANKENNASMAPPSSSSRHDRRGSAQDTSNTASADPYAEERARAQQNREAREEQRRMSSSTSLGKRGREDEETFDAPRGPKGDRNRVKKGRKERRVNYKYEDEVGGSGDGDERDAGRWR